MSWTTGGARACVIGASSFSIPAFKKALFSLSLSSPEEREAKRKIRMRSYLYRGGADWRSCRCDSFAGAPASTGKRRGAYARSGLILEAGALVMPE